MIDLSKIKGIIFDCDGVLVDSEKLSCGALNVVFEEKFKVDIGTDYSKVVGKSGDFAFKYYLKKFKINNFDLDELMTLKEKTYFTMAEDELNSFPRCEEFILLLNDLKLIISVGSSGSHNKINFSLQKVALIKYFDIIVSTYDVDNGKPSPDLFLKAAKEMRISPENCLVIEDSLAGIQAAVNAKMKVVGFPGSFPINELEINSDYIAINGYSDLIKLFDTQLN